MCSAWVTVVVVLKMRDFSVQQLGGSSIGKATGERLQFVTASSCKDCVVICWLPKSVITCGLV
jgi:hypothetical protein